MSDLMTKYFMLTCLLLLSFCSHSKEFQGPSVRAYVEPEADLYVGQIFTLYLEVKVPSWLVTSPDFPNISFDDAFSLRPEQLGENFVEKNHGDTYSGLRQRYLIVSHQEGTFSIPSYRIRFSYAGANRKPVDVTLSTKPIELAIRGISKPEVFLDMTVARDLTYEQEFIPALDKLKVGDSFTRKIMLQGEQTMGFLLPELRFTTIENVLTYPSRAKVDDELIRGNVKGQRTESASYLLQHEGRYKLPEISFSWFDLSTETIRTESIPSVVFEVSKSEGINDASSVSAFQIIKKVKKALYSIYYWLHQYWMSIFIGFILVLLLCGVYVKFGSDLKIRYCNLYQGFIKTNLYHYIRLLFITVFCSRPKVYVEVIIWVKQDANKEFKSSIAWKKLQGSYGQPPTVFNRSLLLRDLLVFGCRKLINKTRSDRLFLNP